MKAFQTNQLLTVEAFAPMPAQALPECAADYALLRAMSPNVVPGAILNSAPAHDSGGQITASVPTRWFQPVSFPVKISQRSRGNLTQRIREILC